MVRADPVELDDAVACPACGVEIERADLWSGNGADDPLQVYECENCTRVIDVGAHLW